MVHWIVLWEKIKQGRASGAPGELLLSLLGLEKASLNLELTEENGSIKQGKDCFRQWEQQLQRPGSENTLRKFKEQ